MDLQIHDGADPGESVGKDPEQSAMAETGDIVSVLRTFVERKLSTRLRLGFTPSVIGELFQTVGAKDYPLMQGIFLIITLSVLLANFLADLAYLALDPRTRRES